MGKSILLTLILLLAFVLPAIGLDVSEEELGKARGISVEFINYEGPHDKIETIPEITAIGESLGSQIAAGRDRASYGDRYRVIHAVDPNIETGLDADIFIIETGAAVDHIDNLRRIIAGYLRKAYEYDDSDSMVIAEFITVYNAVFRGKMDYFSENYKSVVTGHLTASNAGLARIYSEWAGSTRMVIPLGGLGAVDADSLTGEAVVEELREQEDKGLPVRKEMTELKEREVEEVQEQLEKTEEDLASREDQLEQEKSALEETKKELEKKPDPEVEKVVEEKEAEIRQEEAAIAEERTVVEEQKKDLEERQERIRDEREAIVTDERALIQEQNAAATEAGKTATESAKVGVTQRLIPVILVSDSSGEALGRIVLVDTASAVIETRSSLNTIRNRTFDLIGNQIIVVAGKDQGNAAVRLVSLNSDSLEVRKEGDIDIYPGSVVILKDSVIYAVAKDGNNYRLSTFNTDLEQTATSAITVDPNTALAFDQGRVFVQNARGTLVILNAKTLETVSQAR